MQCIYDVKRILTQVTPRVRTSIHRVPLCQLAHSLTHAAISGMLPAMFLARVYVTLKPTVNDPPGLTIRGGLHSLGFTSVSSVRSGKYMEIRLDATTRADAEAQVAEMCRKLLANPVIEDFRFELEDAATR